MTRRHSKQIHAGLDRSCAHVRRVVVGLRPNPAARRVSAYGGDRRGQWNHARTMPNNLEWHIDIGSFRPTAAPHNRE